MAGNACQRYFEIHNLLNTDSAEAVYEHANELLQHAEYSAQGLLKKMKVEVVCTTDHPSDRYCDVFNLHVDGDVLVVFF